MATPRSYLFVTWEGGGNVPPVLGLVRRLAERGHAVRVLTEPCLEQPVRDAGAQFIPFTEHFTRTRRSDDLMGDWKSRTPLGALDRTMKNVIFGPSRIVAQATRLALDSEATDVLAADVLMPGALAAAEAAGIPRVAIFHMPEYLPGPGRPAAGPGFRPREDLIGRLRDGLLTTLFLRVVGKYVDSFNAARRDLGLPQLADARALIGVYHEAHLRLIQTARAFDFPITPAPANVRYVGPVLDEPDWTGTWDSPWPPGDRRPLVVASLSTTFQNQRAVLDRIAQALGALDVRGLITLGPAMAGARLALPPNVRAVDGAPHSRVFPEAAVVVTHGGHGTIMRALAHGLPIVCLPMGRDQDDNAARLVHHGAGLRARPSASPATIRALVRRALDETGFRDAAAQLQRAISADVAEDRATRELEGLAAVHSRPLATV